MSKNSFLFKCKNKKILERLFDIKVFKTRILFKVISTYITVVMLILS